LRNKYFFGEGYTYGSQLERKGPGMERVYEVVRSQSEVYAILSPFHFRPHLCTEIYVLSEILSYFCLYLTCVSLIFHE
jgi:hypothetical protein